MNNKRAQTALSQQQTRKNSKDLTRCASREENQRQPQTRSKEARVAATSNEVYQKKMLVNY